MKFQVGDMVEFVNTSATINPFAGYHGKVLSCHIERSISTALLRHYYTVRVDCDFDDLNIYTALKQYGDFFGRTVDIYEHGLKPYDPYPEVSVGNIEELLGLAGGKTS